MFIVDDVALLLMVAAISKVVLEVSSEVGAELIVEGLKQVGSPEALWNVGSAINDNCIAPAEGAFYHFAANTAFEGDCMTMLQIVVK